MPYRFTTPDQQREMLDAVGAASIEDLLSQVPRDLRLNRPLDLPPALTEPDLERRLRQLASRNVAGNQRVCFLGGGAYDHFIPAVVDEIVSRGEFYTAYTPYQAEASQGSLQAFFEFQSLIGQLTGMDVANASLYEGGTAVSEAVFMAQRVTGRNRRVVVLGSVHPQYRDVVDTYTRFLDCEVVTVPTPDGYAKLADVQDALNNETACLVIQHPNYFGCLEDVEDLVAAAHAVGALAIVSVNPISLGVLKRPGDYGADIVVAEGQPLGIPLQYGGPYLGLFACRSEFVRKMPGRLVGQAKDRKGRTCYVLSLQTREQHIRRDKATSNICTNQGLLALRATVYLATLGPQGLKEVAALSCQKAHYAAERLAEVSGLSLAFNRPFFNEFSLRCDGNAATFRAQAAEAGFDIGPEAQSIDGADSLLLVAVTEQRTREEIDRLADALGT
ncbi:MAG: aminomethyl-transferring glycine dehydrogenase subunit GcvPA [Planctomycetaceae bacterium]|nr:aminomethyl-transferring glycine dehydrogenase subunit GcvPA [Planctomycetaceae bacterium]